VKGLAPRVQIDVVDGSIAPVRTWPYEDNKTFKHITSGDEGLPYWEDFEFEVHLMVRNPEREIKDWLATGISSVVFHPRFSEHPEDVMRACRAFDVEVGLAFLPSEEHEIEKHIVALNPDFIQIMGNDKIGYHGVELDNRAFEIIRTLRTHFSGAIAIDIGVNEKTAAQLVNAGATKLVAGSAIFGNDNLEEIIHTLQSL
jgi:ribulose-phosphate 3-epimerase